MDVLSVRKLEELGCSRNIAATILWWVCHKGKYDAIKAQRNGERLASRASTVNSIGEVRGRGPETPTQLPPKQAFLERGPEREHGSATGIKYHPRARLKRAPGRVWPHYMGKRYSGLPVSQPNPRPSLRHLFGMGIALLILLS